MNRSKKEYTKKSSFSRILKDKPKIYINKLGEWKYNKSIINRKSLVRLFANILTYDKDNYWLITPYERELVEVEDLPFYIGVVEFKKSDKNQSVTFETTLGQKISCNRSNPFLIGNDKKGYPLPSIVIRGELKARVSRQVYYDLVERSCCGPKNSYGFWSEKTFFIIKEGK